MIRSDALRALISLREQDTRFDLVLLDPPYNGSPDMEPVLSAAGELLTTSGLLVYEHARRSAVPDATGWIAPLVRTRQLISGDSALTFYARRL